MISLVIPCHNEAQVLELTYRTLLRAAETWNEAFEIVIVDDGSVDATWRIIVRLAEHDHRIRGVRLSRNFGQQAALGAGLERASGDAVVMLDADLQDPPAVIEKMLAKWRAGFEVVYAQRMRRRDVSPHLKMLGYAYYRILERISTVAIPRDTGDFALIDAKVVRAMLACRERAVFWRGLRCWTGFRHAAVEFDRPGRAAGETSYTLARLSGLALDGLLSFSKLPLRLALYAGSASLVMSVACTGGALAHRIAAGGTTASLLPWWAIAVFYLGSVQLLALGIIGEYLNRIYDEVRARPRWIVETTTEVAEKAQPWPERIAG